MGKRRTKAETQDYRSLRAVCYLRVSTEEQATEGVSLDAQEEKVRAYCTMRGLELVELVRDEGVSGYKKLLAERPGGSRLLALVAAGEVGHVVALKIDRLFRDAEDALHETKAWDRGGVSLHLVDMGGQAIDTSTSTGRMFLTMMAGVAEWERNVIAERTSAALRFKRSRREVYNHTPFGFERQGSNLVPLAAEQEAVQLMHSLRAEGKSYEAIAAELRRLAVPTKRGGTWAAFTVYRTLTNPLHAQAVNA